MFGWTHVDVPQELAVLLLDDDRARSRWLDRRGFPLSDRAAAFLTGLDVFLVARTTRSKAPPCFCLPAATMVFQSDAAGPAAAGAI